MGHGGAPASGRGSAPVRTKEGVPSLEGRFSQKTIHPRPSPVARWRGPGLGGRRLGCGRWLIGLGSAVKPRRSCADGIDGGGQTAAEGVACAEKKKPTSALEVGVETGPDLDFGRSVNTPSPGDRDKAAAAHAMAGSGAGAGSVGAFGTHGSDRPLGTECGRAVVG